MRISSGFLLAPLLAASCFVASLPAHADDAATIAACLKAEDKGGHDGRDCIGRVADPCLDKPGGQSTVGMVTCSERETKVWDALLNTEYKRLLASLSAKAAASVKTSERAWIALRDADCVVPYDIFEGGTIAQPIAADCMLSHTAMRAIRLRTWRQMSSDEER